MPIIAVTSLAGEDDIQRGKQIGINEYHIKLDREQLMASVARLLNKSLVKTT
jgi:two-component system chemotaxis sensor kinase CheA